MACGDALIQGLVFDRARIAGCEQVYNGQSVSCPGGSTIAIIQVVGTTYELREGKRPVRSSALGATEKLSDQC